MPLKMVIKLSTYGQFGRPFMNYLESIPLNDKTKEYIEILKLFWDNKYDEVLEAIERNISKLRKGSLYYLLLSIKLSALHRLKREQEVKEIYDELRDNFGNIPLSIKELNISKRTLNDFLSGKGKYLQPNTLRNIIENLEFEINSSLAIPIIKELKKKDIDKKFEENFYKFMRLKIEKQFTEFFTSYLVHYYKQEVKLEKVIKNIESGSLIKERCDYYTRELINSIFEKPLQIDIDSLLTDNQEQKTYTNKDITFKEHPFYSARKILVKRFMKDLNKIRLQEFIEKYIKANSKQKDIIEKYIMNYGRYYEIKNIPKELRPKVPKDINVFVKKYTLKRKPSAISFYVFEGKEREKLVETLRVFS